MVRLPGICSSDRSETVLAHVRLAGLSGTGLKCPDLLGAWACYRCHDVTEKRKADDSVQRAFLEGVIRTQAALIKEGKVHW
jgi:hypothetical protein